MGGGLPPPLPAVTEGRSEQLPEILQNGDLKRCGRTPLNRGEHQETRFGLKTGVVAALFKRVKAQRGLESASTSPTTVKCGNLWASITHWYLW